MPDMRRILVACAITAAASSSAWAEAVVCHYTYGGETRTLAVEPVASPYGVPPVQVGSYFLFRVVFQREPADQAAIKIYAYADRDEGPVPIHQATYPYPLPPTAGRYGFTGLHFVYEPVRDGELQYWCGMDHG